MKQFKMKSFAVVLSVLLGVCAPEVRADVLHVGPGQAYSDIALAITAAKTGDTIEIDEGTYTLSAQLVVDKPITLKGAGPDKTFIDGGWNGTLAAKQPGVMCLLVNSKDAVVSDLTVQHGYSEASTTVSSQGVGIRIAANGGTVRNCVITENCKWSRRTGCAGVSLNSADAVLENCVISDNKSSYSGNGSATDDLVFGAGVMCVAGRVSDCTISGNTGGNRHSRGGGLYLGTANATADHCIISGNKIIGYAGTDGQQHGGGVYMLDGILDNCLIVENEASLKSASVSGGGLYQAGGTVVNCTFAGNSAYAGGGVCVLGGTFVNNLVCDNTALATDAPPDYVFADGVSADHCCLPSYAVGIGTDCVFAKPGEKPCLSDYTIDPGSPCYDKGKDEACAATLDVFGAERVQGDHIDIGASEATPVSGLVASFEMTVASPCSTEPVVLAGSAYGPGVTDENTTYVWKDDRGVELGRGKVLSVCLEPGERFITLTVTSGDETVSVTSETGTTIVDGNVFVEKGATPTPPYNTKATAFTNILDAVAYAEDGMLISIGEGTFYEKDTLSLTKRIRLVGAGTDKTIVDASKFTTKANRAFYINNAQAALSSLTVQNANANQYGAGIAIGTIGGTVTNCVVRDCSISGGNAGYGAGIYMYGINGLVTHSIISENSLPNASAHHGVGICMEGGLVKDSLIIDNTSSEKGTGIAGGGVYADGGRVVNCTITGNFAYTAGGIVLGTNAKAVNCIVYGNEAHSSMEIADFNIVASNRFENCCFPAYAADTDLAKASPGMVFVSSEPYAADYTLEAGSPCEDAGADGYCDDSHDLFGAVRVQGEAIDIGCAEATPSAEMVINLAATPALAIGSADVTLTAFASGGGAKPDLCTYEWTIGDETFSGRTVKRPFGVGRYDVTLKVTSQNGDVKELPVERAFVIYPAEVRVETAANPAWPWDTAANAFTNLAEALEECVDGMTIRMGAGDYPVSRNITVSKAVRVIGAGMDQTRLYRSITGDMRVLTIDNVNAYVAELEVSGGKVTVLEHGGAIAFTEANGGVVERCLITGCEGNDAVSVFGSKSYLRRSIIRGNRCTGVKLWEGGKCESCLITENTASYGAGVLMIENSQGAGYLRNCTVIRNHGTSTSGKYSGAGVYCGTTSGSPAKRYVYNCLIAGNTLASEVENPPPGYPDIQSDPKVMTVDHCYAATEIGENCVFGVDSKVRTSGKIPFGSPCSRTGLYQSWMDGQLDLFGNPRVDAKAQTAGEPCVDIGCCQSLPAGLMLQVR